MSLVLTPMKMEAWLRLNGKSSRGLLAIYGSSVLGVLLTLYWTGLVIYHIYFYSLASYLGPLLATSTPEHKQSLTAAFSNKTLKIIANVVDVFADEIGELGEPKLNGLNMTKWYAYEMLAFDILREMAF
ncbi:hypothetical protein FOXB_16938 [Fusarium oxysporum f. sp. conglutinans Fo5176]|uniref:Uncharacterized protein n=1 Tax=Fusarium oxysporum (strain Fo5176) TaxID=660025 RepID=F9GE54_FUSOF|nr:hypothetical protein FOXB_16938 [Fusarium oxysporum f. sp. conglutinans Fo5176]